MVGTAEWKEDTGNAGSGGSGPGGSGGADCAGDAERGVAEIGVEGGMGVFAGSAMMVEVVVVLACCCAAYSLHKDGYDMMAALVEILAVWVNSVSGEETRVLRIRGISLT